MDERATITRLVDRFDELQPLLNEHLADQGGELLPYLLMADVARWAIEHATDDTALVADVVTALEKEFASGDGAIKDLVGVGFVEMLPPTPKGDPVLSLLGPELAQVAHDMNLFEPWPDAGSDTP